MEPQFGYLFIERCEGVLEQFLVANQHLVITWSCKDGDWPLHLQTAVKQLQITHLYVDCHEALYFTIHHWLGPEYLIIPHLSCIHTFCEACKITDCCYEMFRNWLIEFFNFDPLYHFIEENKSTEKDIADEISTLYLSSSV